MPVLALLLPFLKAWWKVIVPIVLFGIALGYVHHLRYEVGEWRTKYNEQKLAYQKYVDEQKEKQKQLEDLVVTINAKYNNLLKQYNQQGDQLLAKIKENIRVNKELASLRVSYDAIRLLNQSASGSNQPAEAKPGDAPAAPTGEAGTAPLSVVWDTVAENNINHNKCIKQVNAWIDFWHDYEAGVQAVK